MKKRLQRMCIVIAIGIGFVVIWPNDVSTLWLGLIGVFSGVYLDLFGTFDDNNNKIL